jgi:hypothetical protein
VLSLDPAVAGSPAGGLCSVRFEISLVMSLGPLVADLGSWPMSAFYPKSRCQPTRFGDQANRKGADRPQRPPALIGAWISAAAVPACASCA